MYIIGYHLHRCDDERYAYLMADILNNYQQNDETRESKTVLRKIRVGNDALLRRAE